jgi:hypothetical protein
MLLPPSRSVLPSISSTYCMADCHPRKTSQLRLVFRGKIISGLVLGNRFSKHLSVHYMPVTFTEVII